MKVADPTQSSFWTRSHYLDRMTFRDLVVAYFQHYTIMVYLACTLASFVVFALYPIGLVPTLECVAFAYLAWHAVWYAVHRWIMHGDLMYKIPFFASTWKRIHYDHHQDPNHLEVLFGALVHTLPTLAIATWGVGYAIGGIGGAAAAFATGLIVTCYNEFIHCIQHLAFKPTNPMIARLKARHLLHHFHAEDGNYGIANNHWDQIFGTLYERPGERAKSKTVFNLGYTPKVAEQYPWVAELSGGAHEGHPRQSKRAK